MRSQAYWAERATQRMQKVEQMAGRYEAKIIRAYRRTVKHINADVEKLMRRYMWEFGLTEEEALELLNEKVSVQEIKLLQSRLELVKDPKVKKEIAKKIEAKAYAYRMSRLEAVKVDMRMHMEGLKETSHEILTQALQDVSRESRRLLIKDLGDQAKEHGVSIQFGKFDKAVFDTITKERWYGKNYSERVWTNLGKLEKTMYNTWLDGVIQGDSNQRIAKQLSEQMNVGIYAAKRLVRTETCHYTNQTAKKEFEEDGITKYEFSAHLDKRTSDLCRDLDGKVFNVADAAVGKNYPPMHPHCRSVAVAWFGDEEEELQTKNSNLQLYNGYNSIVSNPSLTSITTPEIYSISPRGLMSLSGKGLTSITKPQLNSLSHNNIVMQIKDKPDPLNLQKLKYRLKKLSQKRFSESTQSSGVGKRLKDKFTNAIMKMGREDLPAGNFSNYTVRKWYLYHDSNIPNMIDTAKPLEVQAKEAHALRNTYKIQARELMADREEADRLNREFPPPTWDYIFEKYRKFYSNDIQAIYKAIIEASTRTRQSVNEKIFGGNTK